MVRLDWKGFKGSKEDVYVLISQRVSDFKLIGKFLILKTYHADIESGGTFTIHIDDSKVRDPFWIITDVYGYRNFDKVALCKVKHSGIKYWGVKLPANSFTGSETIGYDGTDFNLVEWRVVPAIEVIVEDCKTWSEVLINYGASTEPQIPGSSLITESDPIFKSHPAYSITNEIIADFHKPLTLNLDFANGLVLNLEEQILSLNLASTESAGAMSIEDKIKLDSLSLGPFYPLYENPAGYLTEETDPIFNSSAAKLISSIDIARWNDAYYWGNHATFGYLTSYTETDPVFTNHPAYNINHGDIILWDEAAARRPVHIRYINITSLIADQSSQINNYIYYVQDNNSYYEYLGTYNSSITDYNLITVQSGIGLIFTPGTKTLNLSNTTVIPGTYGDGTKSARITVDQQGRITAISEVSIPNTGPGGGLTRRNILDSDFTIYPDRDNLVFQRLNVSDDNSLNRTYVQRPADLTISSSPPTENVLEGDEWINNVTWKHYAFYDGYWVQTREASGSQILPGDFIELDPVFQASPAASITQNDIDYWNSINGLIISPTIPTENLQQGVEWLDSTNFNRYVYYDGQFVQIYENNILVENSPGLIIAPSPPVENLQEGLEWLNNITWNRYVYYDNAWIQTIENNILINNSPGLVVSPTPPVSNLQVGLEWLNSTNWNRYVYYDGQFVQTTEGNIYCCGENGGELDLNEVTEYRSSYENSDNKLYSGYLLNGNPVITRRNNNILENALNLTNLTIDWSNRLSLTYTII